MGGSVSNYFNDSPIERREEDLYGVTSFSEALAKSILNIKDPIGTTIALNGAWGSGKSSTVNLIRAELSEAKDSHLIVTEFKCWWYRGEEALALAFLQQLNSVLGEQFGDKTRKLVRKLGRGILQAGPVIGPAIALTPVGWLSGLVGGLFDVAKRLFPDEEPLETVFRELSKVLEAENRRFLVIIDDMDRLSSEEALAIFRLIKSVGRLPNVMYLVVFDRQLAEQAINEKYPSEGPHFLEKIIQAGFELPMPVSTDLNNAVLASIDEICGTPSEDQIVRFMNVFYDVVAPYITSPRHVSRFQNAISVTWPAIAGEVNLADFVALEILRLYEPTLFSAIKGNKSLVCGTKTENNNNNDDRFSIFLNGIEEGRQDVAKTALQRLFPRLESIGYGGEWISEWSSERRVCVEAHFDTYFRLNLSDEVLSGKAIDELIEKAGDSDYIKKVFMDAANARRRTGQSMVPVYFDELTTHGKRVDKDKVRPLLSALFEIHDAIDLKIDADSGFMAMANTTLRYHWLIRKLTRNKFSIEERTDMYLKATEAASLGWLINFVSSARGDYQVREDRQPTAEEDCLVSENVLPELTKRALNAIRTSSADGSLLVHKDLLYILYRWIDFMGGDPTEARAWTDSLLDDRKALLILVKVMTGASWSMGMGGFGSLGDRVSKRTVRAQISDDSPVIDARKFRAAIEKIANDKNSSDDEIASIQTLLSAWDHRARGED
ncbi:AAA family ATPase [Escherichia coli]|jgi:predicted KAP-like P-loop ATPase|nr:P-loop NTPase fold protein [Providencia stuartii]EAA9541351.1 NTPase KAP [Salmonella enterica subsp. enterica]EAP1820779.1 NTPase KAP [Salmonella enterica]EAP3244292.1 NTPase KAP [Salmonella enterica subsp. enterica serovar Johannesburg]EFC5368557.1 AAA family ATPase [Escherichia coli]EGT0019045.1 AAA family ATPase [Citrobacter freundii]EKW0827343.1 AAA family ATPase [Klebsiella pneumoniae]EMG65524.1 KAP P-loop domain-containing protein [Salmonella enterica subsp. enterica serovar Newport